METTFTKKIIDERTVAIFGSSVVDKMGKTLHIVYALPKKDEAMVLKKGFNILEDSNVILVGSGELPDDIENIVTKLLKENNT